MDGLFLVLQWKAFSLMMVGMGLGFVVGLLLLLLVGVSVWIAAAGFVLMTLSALLAYRYAGRLGDDRAASGTFGRLAARVAGKLRRPASGTPPEE